MRYENWDILLFPRDSKIPLKEFSASCYVMTDSEFDHRNEVVGIPTVCCFTPSLVAGDAFRVSIHAWTPPEVSQYTKSYTKHHDFVKIESRVYVDGRLVAASVLPRIGSWPHVIANTCKFTKDGTLDLLRFPAFNQELLQQKHWSPGDCMGRIKVVLAEVFEKNSPSMPLERLKNVVAFSFQHAPIEILEASRIAWPRPSMWGVSAAADSSTMLVPSFISEDPDTHAHSPRRGKTTSHGKDASSAGLFTPSSLAGYRQGETSISGVEFERQRSSAFTRDLLAPDSGFYLNSHAPSAFQAAKDSLLGQVCPQTAVAPDAISSSMKMLTHALLNHPLPQNTLSSSADGTQQGILDSKSTAGISSKPKHNGGKRTNTKKGASGSSSAQESVGSTPEPVSLVTSNMRTTSTRGADITKSARSQSADGDATDKGKKRARSGSLPSENGDKATPTVNKAAETVTEATATMNKETGTTNKVAENASSAPEQASL